MSKKTLLFVSLIVTACTSGVDKYRTEEIFLGAKIPAYKLEINQDKIQTTGALTKDLIYETLEDRKDLFSYCYEDALLKDKKLQGQVVWQIETNKKGLVTSFKYLPEQSTAKSGFLVKCMNYHLVRTKFPASIKGDSKFSINALFAIIKD